MLLVTAEYIEKLYGRLGTFWHRKRNDTEFKQMLTSILNGNSVELANLLKQLIDMGHEVNDRYFLLQIRQHFAAFESMLGSTLTEQLESMWPGTTCFQYKNSIIVLLNITKHSSNANNIFSQEIAVFLRDSLLEAGISRDFDNIMAVDAAYKQTEIALDMGNLLNSTYWYHKFDDYAYLYLLKNGYNGFYPDQICDPAIRILQTYDKKNNTDLYHTLKIYIMSKYNAVEASNKLCIARSSFLKRLERIKSLSKIDFNDYDRLLYLALSYQIFDNYYFPALRDNPFETYEGV